MELSQEQVKGGIVFGDWMLAPLDSRNWELCHRHVAKAVGRHKGGTEPEWHRLSRFYQFNTFDLALQYAADEELKGKAHGTVMKLHDAIGEYRTIVTDLKSDVLAAIARKE